MKNAEELMEAVSTLQFGSPEARSAYLNLVFTHPNRELAQSVTALLLPYLSESERQSATERFGGAILSPDFKPNERMLSSFLASALSSADGETRKQAAEFIMENEDKFGWELKQKILFLLADPREEVRDASETLLINFKGESTPSLDKFVNAFLFDMERAGLALANEISTKEAAIPFIYLCLAKYDFSAPEEANKFPVALLCELFRNMGNQPEFYKTENAARQLFLADQLPKGVRGEKFALLRGNVDTLIGSLLAKSFQCQRALPAPAVKQPACPVPPKAAKH